MSTDYERIQELREAARPMDEAWDKLCAAEWANAPVDELERLATAHREALERYTAWCRQRNEQ